MSDSGMEGQFFHVLSRINGRARVLEESEREAFRSLLRRAEKFSGVEVITWAMLSNHFHIVVHIPAKPPEITDEVFRERLKALYSREEIDEIRATMQRIPEMTPGLAGEVLLRQYRQRFLDRMGDLSEFMKTLLQRFTQWFNKRHDRVGRLWESRFRSVLVEGAWEPLMRVAAYVDLARRHDLDPALMALAFVYSRPFLTSSIVGATNLAQLKTAIDSKDLTLPQEVLDGIEAIHEVHTYPCP